MVLLFLNVFYRMPSSTNNTNCNCEGAGNIAHPKSWGEEWQAHREKKYQADMVKLKANTEKLLSRSFPELVSANKQVMSSEQFCVPSQWHVDLPFPWFVFLPSWSCPFEERIGDMFDGGKWLCNIERLKKIPDCVIYSFGSNYITDFEVDMNSLTQCEVHIFDPTVNIKDKRYSRLPKQVHIHDIGLGPTDGKLKFLEKEYDSMTLQSIMKMLGHKRINVLKIDIDGGEHQILDVFSSPTMASAVDELLLEMHFTGIEGVVKIFDNVHRSGFRAFHHEANLFYKATPAAGMEYSFVKPQFTLP